MIHLRNMRITVAMIHRDSHWINSVTALIWIFISRWGGSSMYCELQGIWRPWHMKRIKSVCLHCQVTVVFRSVVTCYTGKPYLGLSMFNKTMKQRLSLHRLTKRGWQKNNKKRHFSSIRKGLKNTTHPLITKIRHCVTNKES